MVDPVLVSTVDPLSTRKMSATNPTTRHSRRNCERAAKLSGARIDATTEAVVAGEAVAVEAAVAEVEAAEAAVEAEAEEGVINRINRIKRASGAPLSLLRMECEALSCLVPMNHNSTSGMNPLGAGTKSISALQRLNHHQQHQLLLPLERRAVRPKVLRLAQMLF